MADIVPFIRMDIIVAVDVVEPYNYRKSLPIYQVQYVCTCVVKRHQLFSMADARAQPNVGTRRQMPTTGCTSRETVVMLSFHSSALIDSASVLLTTTGPARKTTNGEAWLAPVLAEHSEPRKTSSQAAGSEEDMEMQRTLTRGYRPLTFSAGCGKKSSSSHLSNSTMSSYALMLGEEQRCKHGTMDLADRPAHRRRAMKSPMAYSKSLPCATCPTCRTCRAQRATS